MIYVFNVKPIGKPRMTQQDKWLNPPRDAVAQYFAFKEDLGYKANLQQFRVGKIVEVVFLIPMPPSWSQKKRDSMRGCSHEMKPDTDNMLKAFFDALTADDSVIWHKAGRKFWWDDGYVIVTKNSDQSGELPLNLRELLKPNYQITPNTAV